MKKNNGSEREIEVRTEISEYDMLLNRITILYITRSKRSKEPSDAGSMRRLDSVESLAAKPRKLEDHQSWPQYPLVVWCGASFASHASSLTDHIHPNNHLWHRVIECKMKKPSNPIPKSGPSGL